MTTKTLKQIKQIDAVAERAGGYVINPAQLQDRPECDKAFTAMRKFSRENGIPMTKLSINAFTKRSG